MPTGCNVDWVVMVRLKRSGVALHECSTRLKHHEMVRRTGPVRANQPHALGHHDKEG